MGIEDTEKLDELTAIAKLLKAVSYCRRERCILRTIFRMQFVCRDTAGRH